MSNAEQPITLVDAYAESLAASAAFDEAWRSGDRSARHAASAALSGVREQLVSGGVMDETAASLFSADVQRDFHMLRWIEAEVLGVV